ncbi:DNA/RNA non-specific endonuclease, partial [Yersinia wautersii]
HDRRETGNGRVIPPKNRPLKSTWGDNCLDTYRFLGGITKGVWRKMENSWAKALEDGKSVKVKINPIYTGDSSRPSNFEIKYTIGNE